MCEYRYSLYQTERDLKSAFWLSWWHGPNLYSNVLRYTVFMEDIFYERLYFSNEYVHILVVPVQKYCVQPNERHAMPTGFPVPYVTGFSSGMLLEKNVILNFFRMAATICHPFTVEGLCNVATCVSAKQFIGLTEIRKCHFINACIRLVKTLEPDIHSSMPFTICLHFLAMYFNLYITNSTSFTFWVYLMLAYIEVWGCVCVAGVEYGVSRCFATYRSVISNILDFGDTDDKFLVFILKYTHFA